MYPQTRIAIQGKQGYEQIYIKELVLKKYIEWLTFDLHFLIFVK